MLKTTFFANPNVLLNRAFARQAPTPPEHGSTAFAAFRPLVFVENGSRPVLLPRGDPRPDPRASFRMVFTV